MHLKRCAIEYIICVFMWQKSKRTKAKHESGDVHCLLAFLLHLCMWKKVTYAGIY